MKVFTTLLCALLFMPVLALADADAHDPLRHHPERLLLPDHPNAKWLSECGDCHVAFPPELLPERTWHKIMAQLDKHFGADASLSKADRKEVEDFLVKYSSGHWSGYTSRIRITQTPGFLRRHRGLDLPEPVWDRPEVKSAANCGACHPGATDGNYDEHQVKIPGYGNTRWDTRHGEHEGAESDADHHASEHRDAN